MSHEAVPVEPAGAWPRARIRPSASSQGKGTWAGKGPREPNCAEPGPSTCEQQSFGDCPGAGVCGAAAGGTTGCCWGRHLRGDRQGFELLSPPVLCIAPMGAELQSDAAPGAQLILALLFGQCPVTACKNIFKTGSAESEEGREEKEVIFWGRAPHPRAPALLMLNGSRTPGFVRLQELWYPAPDPTTAPAGGVQGSPREGQASCFVNSSSHFQTLANSPGHAARPSASLREGCILNATSQPLPLGSASSRGTRTRSVQKPFPWGCCHRYGVCGGSGVPRHPLLAHHGGCVPRASGEIACHRSTGAPGESVPAPCRAGE